jgi:hypothetical protein
MMTTTEIGRESWEKLCERITNHNPGSLVNVELVQPDGLQKAIAHDLPLRQIGVDAESDACNDLLILEMGHPTQKPLRHVIVEPIHVRLRHNGQGRYHRLEVAAENGTTTIDFRPGLPVTIADGV